ncbi:LPS export ABC transporter periplasmic protein LptC [Croceicoccus estronivorus]|uniref:LPS export ABC transporter periplasmic protein LptC n=1 Tax=Croceicoccus estronivorus TaxID=1172626 RepID=UPI0008314EFD|nr:LPS export ABC transporter periplasmic protein LptC [Croceicoccus estronivorus]OCC23878.1 LPS export ABC transporter periplasmic protein LptC [Croceicoccus estronivorus]
MSKQADIIRDHRRVFAAPNGAHDRLVGWLTKVLPAAIGVLAALMLLFPLAPRGDISFLLDRNDVAIVKDRLRVDNAMYRGVDNKGRPFSLMAGRAVQRSSREAIVRMDDLKANILLSDGPAMLAAANGRYDIDKETVAIDGPVQFTAADGYRMTARDVTVDLEAQKLTGEGKVEGAIPAGTFSADHISADLGERIVALYGNARLHMTPGQLRMPQ